MRRKPERVHTERAAGIVGMHIGAALLLEQRALDYSFQIGHIIEKIPGPAIACGLAATFMPDALFADMFTT
ncbi:MAG: hypothetical protein ABFD97_08740 [Syntrophobacter sp.]